MDINSDDLKFKDIMNVITERITPEQLIFGFDAKKLSDPSNPHEWLKQFDSFKVKPDDLLLQIQTKNINVDNGM